MHRGGSVSWLVFLGLFGVVACGETSEGSPAAPAGAGQGGVSSSGGGAGNNAAGSSGGAGAGSGGASAGGSIQGGAGQSSGGSGGQDPGGQGGAPGEKKVSVFVAQGHVGRTMVSCDAGMTWTEDRSDDDAWRCFVDEASDCDHHPGAARGITFGKGYFVATFGWGKPGSVRRSRDGIHWENTLEGKTFAGVAFGADAFLLGERPPRISQDDGKSWEAGGDPNSDQWNVRRTGFADHDGGRFLLAFGSDKSDLNVSKDLGKTWTRPATLPASCAADIQWSGGIEYGTGAIVVVGGDGTACRSVDGGDSWSAVSVGGTVSGRLLWTGTHFLTWGSTPDFTPCLFRSADGASWEVVPMQLAGANSGPRIGAVARSEEGVFVASNEGWQVWYEKQEFYRSTDGISWQTLPASAFKGGHPIQFIAAGKIDPALACP